VLQISAYLYFDHLVYYFVANTLVVHTVAIWIVSHC